MEYAELVEYVLQKFPRAKLTAFPEGADPMYSYAAQWITLPPVWTADGKFAIIYAPAYRLFSVTMLNSSASHAIFYPLHPEYVFIELDAELPPSLQPQ